MKQKPLLPAGVQSQFKKSNFTKPSGSPVRGAPKGK